MTSRKSRFLTIQDVEAKVRLSRAQIYKMMAEDKFPKSRRAGARARRWDESEVDDWMDSCPVNESSTVAA